MDKEQREHEAAMKKKEDESRESGNNRDSSGTDKNASSSGHSADIPAQGKDDEKTNSKTFNAGGNDSDYDGGHPKDASPDDDDAMNSNSTNSKEN